MWPKVGTRQAFFMFFLKNKVPISPICFAVFQFVPPCALGNYPTDLVGLNIAPPFLSSCDIWDLARLLVLLKRKLHQHVEFGLDQFERYLTRQTKFNSKLNIP
jgi:hypothetical protein